MKKRFRVTELEKAVLDYVVNHGHKIRISECASDLGISPSQVKDTLESLFAKGFLIRKSDSGQRQTPVQPRLGIISKLFRRVPKCEICGSDSNVVKKEDFSHLHIPKIFEVFKVEMVCAKCLRNQDASVTIKLAHTHNRDRLKMSSHQRELAKLQLEYATDQISGWEYEKRLTKLKKKRRNR